MKPALALICAVLIAFPAAAQEVGRLFFTPQQRDVLDARRRARVPDQPAATPLVASPTTRLDGYVQRSDGRATVWVNGDRVDEPGAARVEPGRGGEARVSVTVGNSGARVRLRPGEVLDRGSGEVADVLGPSGEIRVRSSR
jgi:hypothetical protein